MANSKFLCSLVSFYPLFLNLKSTISYALRNTIIIIHLLENLGRENLLFFVIVRTDISFSLIIFLSLPRLRARFRFKINRSIEKSGSIGKSFLHLHFFSSSLLFSSSSFPPPSPFAPRFAYERNVVRRSFRDERNTLRLCPNRVAIRRHLATARKVRYEVTRRLTGEANERRNVPVDSKRTIDDYHKFIRDLSGSSTRLVLSPRQREETSSTSGKNGSRGW